MTVALRIAATAIALAGAVDPSWTRRERAPLAVEFRVGSSRHAQAALHTLREELGATITSTSRPGGAAVVVIDEDVDPSIVGTDVPVSFLLAPPSANVTLLAARASGRLTPGQEGILHVTAEAAGVAGRTSRVTVLDEGVEVGRIEHTWTAHPTARLEVPFFALAPGGGRLVVRMEPLPGESREDDNTLEAAADIENARLRVAFFEPRPSWAAGLVRRAIEQDAAFDVSSLLRPSRGIDVRTPGAPSAITSAALASFDAIAVGAPDELRPAELEALRAFAADRGGTVVFLPDRRPSGAYAAMVAQSFEEVLLSRPATLHLSPRERGPRSAELCVVVGPQAELQPLASLADGRPVIAARSLGHGTLIFSGALDAWRYRADQGQPFAAFWRGALARAALAAAPPLSVALDPGVVRGSRPTRVQVRLRKSELQLHSNGAVSIPFVRAVAVPVAQPPEAAAEPIRLWPTGEPGVLAGRFTPTADTDYDILATAANGARGRAMLRRSDASRSGGSREEALAVAAATGGVASEEPGVIAAHLRALPARDEERTRRPMRSGWWVLPFALALCAEWALRRRSGRR